MENQLLDRAQSLYRKWDQCGLTDEEKVEAATLSHRASLEHNYRSYRILVKILDAYGYGGYPPYRKK